MSYSKKRPRLATSPSGAAREEVKEILCPRNLVALLLTGARSYPADSALRWDELHLYIQIG